MGNFVLPSHNCQFVGTSDKSEVWFTQLLPGGEKFPGVSNYAGTTEPPSLTWGCGVMWRNPGEYMTFLLRATNIAVWYERVFGLVVVWAHPHQACYHTLEKVAHKWVCCWWMKAWTGPMPLSNSTRPSPMCPYWVRDMSAPGQMAFPAWKPGAGSTSCRYANCCNRRMWWYAWKVWMVNLKPCSLPSRNCHFGNAATTDRSGPWHCAAWEYDNQDSRFPLLHWYYPPLADTIELPVTLPWPST